MSVWPVFVLAEMHLDEGSPFSVGEIASWPVELRDGLDTGCPRNELRDVSATLKASDASSVAGSLAVMPGLSVWWRGPQPPGCTLTMSALLVVDISQPPPTTINGTVRRIRIASSPSRLNDRGVWMPTGQWTLADTQTASKRFRRDYENPGADREIGLLVDLDVIPDRPSAAASTRNSRPQTTSQ
jgi:hypothetical protein